MVESLSNQLDLRRTYYASDLVIFENVSWLPIISVLDEESSVASEQAGDIALTGQELKSTMPLLVDQNSVANKRVKSRFSGGTVHLAVPFDSRWQLFVDGALLSPRVAFGSSTAFDAPIAGVVSLHYKTSPLRYLYLILQTLAWLCLLMLAANFSRFRRRIRQIDVKKITLVPESPRPEQKIDMASR
ncbi:MAG: hypothetical protein EB089_07365 [Acidimicrobiia bacterium]|nr:hypothetical protein [Acidimicrobiia bacterium]NDD73105.1 hypothetical protein [Actinomycetota bacterium]